MGRIQTSGVLLMGTYSDAVLPWADPATGSGFEPDLAREIAGRMFDGVTVELVPLTAPQRFEALEDGTIDILVRGTAHTTSRAESMDFTVPYLLDGIVVVVGDVSGFAEVGDLDGTTLAVMAGTTLELEASRRLRAANVSVDLERADTRDAMRAGFAAGAVDGYIDGWFPAMMTLNDQPGLRAIWVGATDPIAIAARPDDAEFVARLDETLQDLIADGTWDDLAARWFPAPVPWTTQEMLTRPPSDR
jgi:ABC-type amino acid transport substrate-binding protein